MTGKELKNFGKRIFAVLFAVSIGVSAINRDTPCVSLAAEEGKIIVSLGDSFSSGEGIPPFYGQEEGIARNINNPDWLAHRSQYAWPGMLTLPSVDGKMSDKRGENWFFAAASGAETKHMFEVFHKDYKKGKYKSCEHEEGRIDKDDLPAQLAIFDELDGKKADYVTLTIGGNDVGFSEKISECVIHVSHLMPDNLTNELNDTWKKFFEEGGIRDKLYHTYKEIADRAGSQAQIIVVGYPQLLDTEGHSITETLYMDRELAVVRTLGTADMLGFSVLEAFELNDAVSKFNRAIESIVNNCKGNEINIYFVSVEEEFKGHEAYSTNPYINPVMLFHGQDLKDPDISNMKGTFFSAYSIHPNKAGARAYARCVQEKIDELENVPSAGNYTTKLTLTVYDSDDFIYDNYNIRIAGKEFVGPLKWGLLRKDYEKLLSVDQAGKQKINLPKGDYSITVTDGRDKNNYYKKDVKIRTRAKKEELIYRTDFGQISEQEDADDKTDGNTLTENIPPDAVEYNGHYYYLYAGGTVPTYEEAADFCSNKGGYLATLTSQEENDFVYSYIIQQGCESAFFGLSDYASEGNWEWCTGEPLYYTNWHSGEPNNEKSNEDYAQFYYKYSDGFWNDGNFDGRTLNGGNAFICEWGDYIAEQTTDSGKGKLSNERNIVLTLDISGSMSGTPMEETKKASTNFIHTVLEQDAGIGIVAYNSVSDVVSGLSTDRAALQSIVSALYDTGGTNMEAGLRDAWWMLEKVESKKKIIVLMSDGEPNEGLVDEDLIAYADKIKKTGVTIYTIGFFGSLSERSYAQYLMESIASGGCHYEVANADELVFFFEDMADQINGQKYIYVRIACPVDVSVTFDGETLDSSEENFNARTSFGTLTFEENREEAVSGFDNRVKVLRLKEGAAYDLKLTGTGHGMMNYTIGFMNNDGEYSDLRKFENIKITRRTRIETVAVNSDESMLNIDEDGDGKYDIRLRAEANGYGEEVKTSGWIIYVIVAEAVFIILDMIAIIIYMKRGKRKGE